MRLPRENRRFGRAVPSPAQIRAAIAGEASATAGLKAARRARAVSAAEPPDAAAGLELGSGQDTPDTPVPDPPPPVPRDLTAAAFFDVDNTMVIGASILHFARGLAARKYFTAGDVMGFAWHQVRFRVSGKEHVASVASGREQALSFVAGRETAEIRRLGEEIYDELIADKIWTGTRALAQLHLDAGQQVWLVTATPVELAEIIARRLGLTGALGTVAESEGGKFTGRLVGDILHGTAKAQAVRSLAAREGLDLRRCTAYSDSHNDVPMLSVVGNAVAVNPDQDLREVAKARGWQIRDFRTGRKAAKIGVPSLLGAGAVAGAVAAGMSHRRGA
ncbi:HAD-IB family hydrolase [Rhodococcus sp. X156]|uniref:HAD family hydrolase n=1 Tax=Rhodococcus sp. X156 TaxID=2499145 RepID=UPI000FD8B24E|nr:HAD-IB family hydrolase [Rhodococcus sp. X156]